MTDYDSHNSRQKNSKRNDKLLKKKKTSQHVKKFACGHALIIK